MKVLIDHCVPRQFAGLLAGHEARTAREMRWDGLKNGVLMAAAAPAGFVALVTTDKHMRHQQSEHGLLMTVFVLLL